MTNLINKKTIWVILSLILLIVLSSCSLLNSPEPTLEPTSAYLKNKSGSVHLLADDILNEISVGTAVKDQESLITYKTSDATILLPDQSKIQLGEFTTIKFLNIQTSQASPFQVSLESGEVWITLESGEMQISTEAGIASVSGSVMHAFYSQVSKNLILTCLEGTCQFDDILIPVGQKAIFYFDGRPTEFIKLSQEDINNWETRNPNSTHNLTQLTATAWSLINAQETATPTPQETVVEEVDKNCELNISWLPKTIKAGETLSTIAFSSGVSIEELAQGNCIKTTDRLAVGSVILIPEAKPTQSNINISCGPPVGWITYTVQEGNQLADIAGAYQATIMSLQLANCLGSSQAVFPGMVIFVPNVIPVTLTPTPTITPTFVIEPSSNTGGSTSSGTTSGSSTSSSATSTSGGSSTTDDDVISISSDSGPVGSLSQCKNNYEIHVYDSDHLALAQLIYELNNSNISGSYYYNLKDGGFDSSGYEIFTKFVSINTADTPGGTSVYYRYKFKDLLGNVYYYPELKKSPYQFIDTLYCDSAGNTLSTTVFSMQQGPTGAQTACNLDYQVLVTNPDGIKQVELAYSTTDPSLATIEGKKLMNKVSGTSTKATYDLLDYAITATNGDTVYYRFEMQDQASNTIVDTYSYSYTSQTCTTGITSYTVSFNTDGGTSVSNQTIPSGGTVTQPSDPTKTGYTFGGWYADSGFTTAWDFTNDTITANTTIYAKFTINTYTVIFDTDGGTTIGNDTVDYGNTVTQPSDPTKTGYTFGGWYADSGFTTAWDFANDTITANTTIYAKFTINSYTVTFQDNGADAPVSPQTVNYGDLVSQPSDPTKTGSSFGDWYADSGFTTAWDFANDTITSNTTIYALWN